MASLTYSDLQTRVANRLRIPTSNTTEMTKLQAVINDVYRRICAKYDWWWLYDRQVIVTSNDITTGTVSVTSGSTSVTFSSAPSVSVAGRILHVPGNATELGRFRISTHTAATTAATLESAYTGSTDTAAGYSVWQDRYDLGADVGKVLWIVRQGYVEPLALISPQEMDRLKAYDTSEGAPHFAAVYGFDTEGDPTTQRQLHIHPYPDDTYTLVVNYRQTLNTEVSSTTRFYIPDDWVFVLEDGALADGYPIFLNDDVRGQLYQQRFLDGLNLMVARQREQEGNPQIVPADNYRSFYQRGRRVTPGTADLGSYFDRWPTSGWSR